MMAHMVVLVMRIMLVMVFRVHSFTQTVASMAGNLVELYALTWTVQRKETGTKQS